MTPASEGPGFGGQPRGTIGSGTDQDEPILVIGGTRATGLLIAHLLLERGATVRVLARDPARARTRLDGRIEIVPGDLTKKATLAPALAGVRHIVFTAGSRSGFPARESRIRATEYEGVNDTLAAASASGFSGRFLYMTASGVERASFASFCLNLYKGNTLRWRRRAEESIRASGLDYTIVRCGFLLNSPGGRHSLSVTQEALPLSLRYRIARADVAEVFVASLAHPRASRATFEVVWGGSGQSLNAQLDSLKPDAHPH
jgi:uncharacterized protein YbjT (DUF2867 family)